MKPKQGYKQTPLGMIPKEWEVSSIADVSSKIGSGKTPSGGESVYVESGIPLVRSKNVGWGNLLLDDLAYITEEIHGTFRGSELRNNDVLVNITGASIGRVCIATELVAGGNVNQHVCIVRPKRSIADENYLMSYLLSNRGQDFIRIFQTSGNRQGLNFEQLSQIPIPLPPLDEQRRIAAVLSTWDQAITQQQELLQQLRLRHQGLAQQLLTGKIRLPGYKGAWKVIKFEEVFYSDGNRIKGSGNADLKLTVLLYCRGVIARENRGTEIEGATKYFQRRAGQFIYGKQNLHKGAFGIIPTELDLYESSSDLPCFTFKKNHCSSFFILLLSRPWFYESLELLATGTGSKRIHEDTFLNIEVKAPPLAEQEAIAAVLTTSEASITQAEAQLATLKEQKKGLMQQLLTGAVRV